MVLEMLLTCKVNIYMQPSTVLFIMNPTKSFHNVKLSEKIHNLSYQLML